MNDTQLLRACAIDVIDDPFDADKSAKLHNQLDKCQNQSTHDGTVIDSPELWDMCRAVLVSSKQFVSDSRRLLKRR